MTKKIIISFLLINFITSCDKSRNASNDYKDVSEEARSNNGILDGSVFTEKLIESKIIKGMGKIEVEKILGHPCEYRDFMSTVRAEYRLTNINKKGLNLIGFSVVYKDDIVHAIDEEWQGDMVK